MGRVDENAKMISDVTNHKIRAADPDMAQLLLLNDIRYILSDISMSMAVIADCEKLSSMSVVSENNELTHNEKRALALRVLEYMKNGDLDGAAAEIHKSRSEESSDG